MDADATGTDVELLRTRKFEVGDLVFAKLKGYPPWPSKINQIESIVSGGKERVRYNVYFYGTHQSSILRSSSLYHYDTYAKSIVDKWGRRPKFHEALEELERELMAKIAYLKELRNTPDSTSPSFNSACNGLLSDIHKTDVRDARPKKGRELHIPKKKRVHDDSAIEWDEESRLRGYEIIFIERIPFPDTPEALLVVSLGFNKEWVREEAQKLEEEERMMNCHVMIEPFPKEYAHLANQERQLSSPSTPDDTPQNWSNSILDSSSNKAMNKDCHEVIGNIFGSGCNGVIERDHDNVPHNSRNHATNMSEVSLTKTVDDCSSIPERVMRFPRQVERKTFHLTRRKRNKIGSKIQGKSKLYKNSQTDSLSKRRRKGKKRKNFDDSDSDSVMETCPDCRLCFFSETELMNHKISVHSRSLDNNIHTISDTESETDIIFNGVMPVTQKKKSSVSCSDVFTPSDNSGESFNKKTVYLTEGFPVDSLATDM